VRRLVPVALALVFAGSAAAVVPTTVLPKPKFPAPANGPGTSTVHFQILSSTPIDPAQIVTSPKPRGLKIDGEDGSTQHYVLGPGYTFDFRNYARAPRSAPGEQEFTYQQVVWARQTDYGVLFVETAHDTYAKSSYGLNGYLNAVDLKTKQLRWRSPAQVANGRDFVILSETIVTGYGFTAEPDYLYAIDTKTGKVRGRLLLPSAPETIARHLHNMLTVTTYDHRLVVRVTGG
jgi:hypothetical protein